MASDKGGKVAGAAVALPLTVETINQHVVRAQYAVRGEIVGRAQQFQEQLRKDPHSLPFDRVLFCNIGNPQQLGQTPITYFRRAHSQILHIRNAIRGLLINPCTQLSGKSWRCATTPRCVPHAGL